MRINGEWLLCEDGVVRPVIRGRIQAIDGSWIITEFLADTGADRTVLNARVLRELGLPPLEPEEDISGLGGMTDSVVVESRLLLTRDTGPPVFFSSRFAAVTDPFILDLSILGRDITDLFAVIIDRSGDLVCLLSQRHGYAIIEN